MTTLRAESALGPNRGAVESEREKDRLIRELRWKVKQLGKQVGRQGQRIYELRCQLAEARSLVTVDASGYRALRDRYYEAARGLANRRGESEALKAKIKELEEYVLQLEGDLVIAREAQRAQRRGL